MPDTTWPVDRHLPGSSRGHKPSPVSMPYAVFRHVISGSLALAFVVYTCRVRRRDFSATLTTPALNRRSSRWFEASPCRAAPEGQTSISCTAPHSVTGSSTSSLLQRSWSHVYATPSAKLGTPLHTGSAASAAPFRPERAPRAAHRDVRSHAKAGTVRDPCCSLPRASECLSHQVRYALPDDFQARRLRIESGSFCRDVGARTPSS